MSNTTTLNVISLSSAEKAIEAGKAKAAQLGVGFTISVVDAGTHLIALSRMDGAALAGVQASVAKARTCALFGASTKDLAPAVQPGAPMFGIGAGFRDELVFVGGGVPVFDADGTLLGAIGVGGGSPDQDHEVAEAVKHAL
jgi:uncharacterized protein GlcG (DUF336 family)